MAIKPISLGETVEYVPMRDRESETPTIFILGVLDSIVRSKLEDKSVTYKYDPSKPQESLMESKWNVAEQALEYVRFGLKGFKNFGDAPFSTAKKTIGSSEYIVVSDDTIKRIPSEIIRELAEEIAKANKESEAEAKN